MADQLVQLPPQNLEAEEYVLGAMMLSPVAIVAAAGEGLTPADFYRHSHGQLFKLMCEMNDEGSPVDVVIVSHRLAAAGITDITNERLQEIATLCPVASNAGHHARIVRDVAALRQLITAGESIARLGWERPGSTEVLIEKAEEALRRAVDHTATTRAATSITDGLTQIGLDIKEASATGIVKTGHKTGFKGLDGGTLRGFWPGQLICLAARPGFGKSTLALNIAENVVDNGGSVLFTTLEMSKLELQMRSLSRASRIAGTVLESGVLADELLAKLRVGWAAVNKRANLHVQDDGSVTPALIGAEARRLKRTVGLDLVVVDYVQLLASGKPENRVNEVGAISRSLKLLARDLNIPVLMLSQLNRGVEGRQEKRPTLGDLRDSGALEQDSDVVMFIYSDSKYDHTVSAEDAGTYELIVEKNRKGATGMEKLLFIGKYFTFKEAA
jgi:replicative DNA helicase